MFETKLTIVLTLSDRLMDLLESSVPRLEKRVRNAVKREVGAHIEKEMEVAIASVDVKTSTDCQEPDAPESTSGSVAPAEAPAPALVEKSPAKALPTEIRAIMDATRRRLLGDDYKEKAATDERVKMLTTAVNRQFINLAQIFGAARPTEIADEATLEKFRADCQALEIDGEGNVVTGKAPF